MSKKFGYRKVTKTGQDVINDINSMAERFEETLTSSVALSRELSLALTKLEECVMWANKAVAIQNEVEQIG
jgi:hypothetical protein